MRVVYVAAILVCAFNAAGATRVGWRKVALNYLFAQPNASAPAAIASEVPFDLLEEYAGTSLAYVPTEHVSRLRTIARQYGIHAVPHDEYDLLETSAGTIDTRKGLPPALGKALAQYRPDEYGLYLLQFLGPMKTEWLTTIERAGGVSVAPVIVNGYLVGATPRIALTLAGLRFVQWIEPFHPYLKGAPHDAARRTTVVVQIADIPGGKETRQRAQTLLTPGTDITNTYRMPGLNAVGTLAPEDVLMLLSEPTVLGIYDISPLENSDERQALGITANTSIQPNGNEVPTGAGTYTSWLYHPTRCPACSSLGLDGFKVSVADSGFDTGTTSSVHPDMTARVQLATTNFVTDPNPDTYFCGYTPLFTTQCSGTEPCDVGSHGTFVTGILAGSGTGTGARDSENFYMGTGIVPSATIVVVKKTNGPGTGSFGNIFLWAAEALNNLAYIQNISQNSPIAQDAGAYTGLSANFDDVVRGIDKDGLATTPVTLTVSAGNWSTGVYKTRAPATAKNVIAVGATEGVRPDGEERTGTWPQNQTPGNTFRNMWRLSNHGTNVAGTSNPWETYIKPDLVAPGTQIAGATTSKWAQVLPATPVQQPPGTSEQVCANQHQTSYGFFIPNSNPQQYSTYYYIGSGTSYAAPVGAGAALIASRIFSATPGAASPALLKAMLTATARSLRGGLGYVDANLNSAAVPILAAPNDMQGFGRIDITDIVDSTVEKEYLNQTAPLPESATWVRTYSVVNPLKPVKMSLAWTDVAHALPLTDPASTLLVNDLDLQVHVGNGVTCKAYYGNNIAVRPSTDREESTLYDCNGYIDTKNNVEKAIFYPDTDSINYPNYDGTIRFTVIVTARKVAARATPPCAQPPCTIEQDFALYVQNADVLANLPAPTLVGAVGGSDSVSLTWTGVQGAAKYKIYRRLGTSGPQHLETVTGLTYTNLSVAPGVYRYTVRAVNAAEEAESIDSNSDYAWVGSFTDDPLFAGVTVVKAAHVTELRTHADEVRGVAGLSAFAYSYPATAGTEVRAADVTELRNALNQARANLGLAPLSFSNVVTSGVTLIGATDVRELREGLR